MALKLVEGFDHFSSALLLQAKGWQLAGTNNAMTFIAGRVSGQAVGIRTTAGANTVTLTKTLPASYTHLTAGFAFQVPSIGTPNVIAELRAGAVNTCQIAVSALGKLQVFNSAATLIGTGATILNAGAFYYAEIELLINGASGSVTAQLDGAAEIAATVGNFGAAAIDNVQSVCSGNLSTSYCYFDDWYVIDAVAPNASFLGDVHVETLYAAADGAHTAWTPNSGTSHFDRVNEHTVAPYPDDDLTYNFASSVGDIDTYLYTSLLILNGSIFGVQTNLYSRKDDAALRKIAPVVRVAATDYVGSDLTLSTSYVDGTQIYDTSPASGAAWTLNEINNAEFGAKVTA